jgi:FkbH-like protein
LVQFKNAEYNQVHQTCLNYKKSFQLKSDEELDVILIFWRVEDFFYSEFVSSETKNFGLEITGKISAFISVVQHLTSEFKGLILINDPIYPLIPENNFCALIEGTKTNFMFHHLVNLWNDKIKKIKSVTRLDLDLCLRKVGFQNAVDLPKWFLYRQPYTLKFWDAISEQINRTLYATKFPARKALILDCDNTLWGGIIGEDLLDGINISDDFPGSVFKTFQKQVLSLKNQGVFIALLSKNNEEDVWEVFDKHDDMILKQDDISAWEINWESKRKNIEKIAKELNISTDSMVFIDDNPSEIEEMKSFHPEVLSLLVPQDDIVNIINLLKKPYLFEKLILTNEDKSRTNMARIELLRKKESVATSPTEFLNNLQLKVEVNILQDIELTRVTQLINKTNQFNLTTIRRDKEQLKILNNSKNVDIFTLRVSDKFGEYGLVGVAIVQRDQSHPYIDTFLMSCRVLGKHIETAFLSELLKFQSNLGKTKILGKYYPTLKNKLVSNFYGQHGFSFINDVWVKELDKPILIPKHINILSNND